MKRRLFMVFMLEGISVPWGRCFHRVAPETDCLLLQAADLGAMDGRRETQAWIVLSASKKPARWAKHFLSRDGAETGQRFNYRSDASILESWSQSLARRRRSLQHATA
jgi:hypothetical protein